MKGVSARGGIEKLRRSKGRKAPDVGTRHEPAAPITLGHNHLSGRCV